MKKKTLQSRTKTLILLIYDALAINISYVFSLILHKMTLHLGEYRWVQFIYRFPFLTGILILIFVLFGIYKTSWHTSSFLDILKLGIATTIASVLAAVVDYVFKITNLIGIPISTGETLNYRNYPIAAYFDGLLITLALIIGIRILPRLVDTIIKERYRHSSANANKRIMIVGAGVMGTTVLKEMQQGGYRFGVPVVIVDDDEGKKGYSINGVPIVSDIENIPEIAKKYQITEIIFCIPSADSSRKKEILNICMSTGCEIRVSPGLDELTNANDKVYEKFRKVDILDLLSRPEVKLDPDVCKYVTGETVLVTGGGGSIGSELCRQIARYKPEKIVIFDIYENEAFTLKNSLDAKYYGTPEIAIRIGSVRDIKRLREIFEEFHPSCVFHAAAHKHVPLMEDSPLEAVKNNILGTYNTAFCSNEYKVKNFVLLSTDKAVNPANVMGATKRVAELIVQHFSRISEDTKFAAVRFGNVLGSHGSVIPIFKEQLEHGGPLTVTHPDITRYFMTIPEAAQLVVQAGGLANGGEIFVLDMGEPVKIVTLAENLIKLSGFEPYKDIDIVFTGLRPGEKLYEELSLEEENENRKTTQNSKIFVTSPIDFDDDLLIEYIKKIDKLSPQKTRLFLKALVPNYTGIDKQ
jgi:FlaA1/EpsC-like NDP-sugar epimerase